MERYLSSLRSFYASSGKVLVAFERYLSLRKSGGNHCHVNVMGVSAAAGAGARQAFQQAAQAAGYTLTPVPEPAPGSSGQVALQGAVGDCEYFMAMLPDGTRLVRPILRGARGAECVWIGGGSGGGGESSRAHVLGWAWCAHRRADEKWPMNLGRDVLAGLAGCPERAEWKACTVEPAEEEQRTEAFKAKFKAFDHTLQPEGAGGGDDAQAQEGRAE